MGADVVNTIKAICGVRPFQRVEPRMIKRECGGWLAVSPRGCSLKIGVTGETEQGTRDQFAASFARTMQILEGPRQ